MNENHQDGQETLQSISALPDFAQIYSFLQYFGKLLFLPSITIYELENFFKEEYLMLENPVTFIQWRLLNNVCKKQAQTEWQCMAVKFGRRRSVLSQTVPYGELPVRKRVKIFRLSCEEQFDSNARFKLELKKTVPPEELHGRPLGADRRGTRHWILRDSVFDFRLFGESGYNEPPPKLATWEELARSPDDLAIYIATLESRWATANPLSQRDKRPSSVDDRNYTDPQKPTVCRATDAPPSGEGSATRRARDVTGDDFQPKDVGKKPKPKRLKKFAKEAKVEGGCLKCHKDVHYKQMLLCDGCDKECHTYCQYPVLWDIPKGKWICPLCKEKLLLEKLRVIHSELSQGRSNRERAMERKQRSVARLQKSGLLLQNIIMDDDTGLDSRRSRRSRKEVNYAELNDVYLPPLGPNDYVRSDNAGRNSRSVRFEDEKGESVHAMCGTRYSKRMRGVSPVDRDEEFEDDVDDDDDDMECGVMQLMEPRIAYSDSDSDSNTEKSPWNVDSESGSGTEDRVGPNYTETYTWAAVRSASSSGNSSPVNTSAQLSSDQHTSSGSSVSIHKCDFSTGTDRTCDSTGSSWCCGVSFLPQKAAKSDEEAL